MVKRGSVVVLLALRTASQKVALERRFATNFAYVPPSIEEPEIGILQALEDLERLEKIEMDYIDGVNAGDPAHSIKEVLRAYMVPDDEIPRA